MSPAAPQHPVLEHQPVWVLASHTITEQEMEGLWRAVEQARSLHTGPGPFVLAVDGRSGAGKSRLAQALHQRALQEHGPQAAALFHLEDLYPGWHGLDEGVERWARMLDSLLSGQDAVWHAWDWQQDRQDPQERVLSAEVPLIIAEGVGTCSPGHHERRPHFGVWLYLERSLRKERALKRDGDTYRPYWDLWAEQEDRLFSR